ncbi:MAG: hypothetical protein EAX96_16610 [Candidatus Lokiarchaeota archaeon]|nr:hypothetical protein [Candidatus Lokiarchaeota archaeon]
MKKRKEAISIQIKPATYVYESKKNFKKLSTGDPELDALLDGGFMAPNLYLLYGNRRIIQKILLTTSINSQLPPNLGGFSESSKVGFLDCNFSFKPFFITRHALFLGLNPNKTLENILISRAFTWENLVELLAERLEVLDIKVIVVSGLTDFFDPKVKSNFQDLLTGIGKLKELILKKKLIGIVTTSYADNSKYKPAGGKILSHFVTYMVEIKTRSNRIEYLLRKGDKPKRRIRWAIEKKNFSLQKSLDTFMR